MHAIEIRRVENGWIVSDALDYDRVPIARRMFVYNRLDDLQDSLPDLLKEEPNTNGIITDSTT